ncbi:transglycosylase-like protein with SLT domain [Kribbella sp. VKM Ac-2527]|uniref:Transglycosylase-like protein with SLT domain n=1 Tax=Kribbella caucasensis TaxID=2512215 RepID=A0A4R6KG88_9ACTN|nr:NlpC/P60 family protein [Kribbella sp. VKM Ac-2527]TDO47287.1 transglycosylase-like protein with SLT domain [Kribbella sp. VKM Ac-2527]
MPKLSIGEIYEAARAAGFSPEQATTWTAIAMAESGGRTSALNTKGEHSVGLWQINVAADGNRGTKYGDLNDPLANARAAFDISRQGRDMRPWTTTHASNQGTSHDYRTYLDKVEAVTGVQGDGRGVVGYGSKLPPPLPSSSNGSGETVLTSTQPTSLASYDRIDAGQAVGMQLDSDSDGLTDAFERAAGTGLKLADTDSDGLADGYEIAVSHSNPKLSDSDLDGLSDSSEASLGSAASKWDSDNDGLSDRIEIEYGSNPMVADAGDGVIPQPVTPPPTPQPVQPTIQTVQPQQPMQPMQRQAGGDQTKVDRFVSIAQAQEGDRYVFGARAKLSDMDPDVFDCSELTKWAAHQAGVEIPDGAMYQYLDLKQKDALVGVDEALRTKGALLFFFSKEPAPGGGRPSKAHVAISLGDGRTIEAKGTKYGVGEFSANNRFNYAGIIPGLDASPAPASTSPDTMLAAAPTLQMPGTSPNGATTAALSAQYDQIDTGTPVTAPPDADKDGLTDAFEKLAGMNPASADTDQDGLPDAFEAIKSHTDPLLADTDKDGLSDPFELSQGSDPGKIPGVAGVGGQGQFAEVIRNGVTDTDKDGLTDTYEKRAGLDPLRSDSDSDGLSDNAELSLGTNPTLLDSDSDGLGDALEVQFGSDPLKPGLGGQLGTAPAGSSSELDQTDGLGPGTGPDGAPD